MSKQINQSYFNNRHSVPEFTARTFAGLAAIIGAATIGKATPDIANNMYTHLETLKEIVNWTYQIQPAVDSSITLTIIASSKFMAHSILKHPLETTKLLAEGAMAMYTLYKANYAITGKEFYEK